MHDDKEILSLSQSGSVASTVDLMMGVVWGECRMVCGGGGGGGRGRIVEVLESP